tara:strand:+ start:159 stop:425 length:267 start_codon:yes stop_codon:yes gene_type:complete
MKIEITCPKCNWKPDGGPHWQCVCGNTWNTFETSGKCPKCSRTWADTQCPSYVGGCDAWSKHIDWYRNLDSEMRKTIERILKEQPLKI